jgi:uncharacterized protein (DUF885 family)
MMISRAPSDGTSQGFNALEEEIVRTFFELQPEYAVFLGLHEYDGRLSDLSSAATDRWTVRARSLLERLTKVPVAELSESRRFDWLLLELLLESPLFDLHEIHELDRNPMLYVSQISLTPYMVRNYAPVRQRVESMVRILESVPKNLQISRQRLRRMLPEPFLRLTLAIGGGLPAHLEEAEQFAARESSELGGKIHNARAIAEAAIGEFLDRVRTEYLPRATPEFALGPQLYQKLLWVREGIRTPADEILEQGMADLRRNQARLEEIARAQIPPLTDTGLLERLYQQHPAAAELIPRAQHYVEEVRAFIEAAQLVTVPPQAKCRVEETPTYGRALSTASMNPPGPFDTSGDEGIYYVTPVDSSWTPEHQEEWLRSFNEPMLKNITVHEVYPGHYLQFLHFRHAANSLARKAYLSNAFTEGWAHYCEQLAIEAGIGKGSPEAEAAQLHDALLRDCRLIASVQLHSKGMTLADATALFQQEAHFEELPAQREAIRGTFNPEYFAYTLGKLTILDVRTKYLASRFGGSLTRFHDRLLAFGAPPVGMLDALMAAV